MTSASHSALVKLNKARLAVLVESSEPTPEVSYSLRSHSSQFDESFPVDGWILGDVFLTNVYSVYSFDDSTVSFANLA
jgi:hypothetical protein